MVDTYYRLGQLRRVGLPGAHLFAIDQTMDEQLAGHAEGRETLREMMKGFPGDVRLLRQRAPARGRVNGGTGRGGLRHHRHHPRRHHRRGQGVQLLPASPAASSPTSRIPRQCAVRPGPPGSEGSPMTTAAPAGLRWSPSASAAACRDQKATEDFYTRRFGFARARVVEADGVRAWCSCATAPSIWSCSRPTPTPCSPRRRTARPTPARLARHLAFQVDDVDAFLCRRRGELEPLL
ncbi:VOC family protein, partial [Streptomyces sp. L7]